MLNIWTGVYKNWSQAEGQDGKDVFDQGPWVEKLKLKFSEEKSTKKIAFSGPEEDTDSYIFDIVLALIASIKNPLSVIDYGGDIGIMYLQLKKIVSCKFKLNYHVVELPEIVKLGKELHSKDDSIHFHEEVPNLAACDILHFGSSLQYLPDYLDVIKFCVKSNSPRYILFSDLMAGDIPTFVTTQNYYGKKVKTWFWSIDDFISSMKELSYCLILRKKYRGIFLGKRGPLPMTNLPKENQLNQASHLLFCVE
jgi:putative methyltransferase (TIGR04325 family)